MYKFAVRVCMRDCSELMSILEIKYASLSVPMLNVRTGTGAESAEWVVGGCAPVANRQIGIICLLLLCEVCQFMSCLLRCSHLSDAIARQR